MPRRIGVYFTLLCLANTLFAQAFRATIVGRVGDQSGAVVVGAKVTVTNTGTNDSRTSLTDAEGNYTVPQLPPGDYSVTVERAGFSKVLRRVVLETGQVTRIDAELRTGAVSQTIEVEAAAPLVNTEDSALGNVVDQKKIVELPLNGRDYLQLAQLQPNVFAPAQGSTLGFRGGFNVAGNSEVANNYIKDGIDNNDETTNQPLQRPILDAVREFKVLTGTYSAEYGRQAGGQIIVTTKSGTNQFHGALWEFHRNSVFDAQNYFAPSKPSFRRNQFGGVMGGPIKTDHTFFFIGYEGQRRGNQEASLATVPTQAFKKGDFSALSTQLKNPFNNNQPFQGNQISPSLWSQQGAGLLALFPDPNRSGKQNFAAAASGRFNINQWSARIDHRFGEKDNVYGIYEFADSNEFFALANPLCSARDVPGYGCDELQRTQHAAISWTHLFSTRLLNEARFGFSRFGFFRLQEDRNVDVIKRLGIGGLTDAGVTPFNNGAPQLIVSGFVTIGGPTNLPQGRHDNTFHYVENMTWSQGEHTLKWGADVRRFQFNSFFTSFGRGSFRFDGRFTGNSVADLLLGMPSQADRNLGYPFHHARTLTTGYYIQDDWKIRSKLTLNLGLRYELNPAATETNNKLASFDPATITIKLAGDQEAFINTTTGLLQLRPRAGVGSTMWNTDTNDFAPRVGLAWRPTGGTNTVVRAGFGIFYNYQIVGNGITPLSRNSPFRQRQTANFAVTARPSLADAFTGNPSVVAPGIQQNFATAYLEQRSLGVQHELARNLVLDVSYLGSEGHKLPIGVNINQAFLQQPGQNVSLNCRRPFNANFCANAATNKVGFGNITGGFVSAIGNSSFHAGQARLERRFGHGLSFISSYTWSKSIDYNSGISTGSDSSGDPQDSRNLLAERGPSDYDTTHRWVMSYVWDLPFGSGRMIEPSNRVFGAIASGWQMTGILTLQTGRPFTVSTGTDVSNTGQNNDRPNLIGDWHVPNPGPNRWFNPCTVSADGKTFFNCLSGDKPAWQVNAPNTFGNAGRNILRADGLKNFDLGVSRSFDIRENKSLQFRAEVFNLANHPNFFSPNAVNVTSSNFGTISRAAFASFTGAQRQVQFGLKFVF